MKGEESRKSAMRLAAILKISGKLRFINELESVPLIALGINFLFPVDFIGVQ